MATLEGLWNSSSEERKKLDWLEVKPFTILFVTGNHENYWMLRELPVEDWHGGKVQRIHPNILNLMRGQFYDIEDAPVAAAEYLQALTLM